MVSGGLQWAVEPAGEVLVNMWGTNRNWSQPQPWYPSQPSAPWLIWHSHAWVVGSTMDKRPSCLSGNPSAVSLGQCQDLRDSNTDKECPAMELVR